MLHALDKLYKLYYKKLNVYFQDMDVEDISINSYQYIYLVYLSGKLTVTEIAEQLGVKKSSASVMSEKLFSGGYFEKNTGKDKRSFTLSVTEKAKTVVALENRIYENFIRSFSQVLERDEWQQLQFLLNKVAENLENETKS